MLAKLVEHPRLSFFASPFITALQTLQLFFPTTALFHFHPSVCRCHFPVRQRIPFAPFPTPAPVSLIMSQLATEYSSKNRLHRGVYLIFSPLRFVPKIEDRKSKRLNS